jgi:hypothetical protein
MALPPASEPGVDPKGGGPILRYVGVAGSTRPLDGRSRKTQGVTPVFKKMKVLAGDVDPHLLADGELGRATVNTVERTGVFAGPADFDAHQVCIFGLTVRLDNQPPFDADVRQQISTVDLAQIVPDHSIVAVRVDPSDHSRVAIDLSTPPPVVTVASSGNVTAAGILAAGNPVRAVIVSSGPMYLKNAQGIEIYALQLTVLADGQPPAQFNLGNPVPAAALPLLYPGCNVPAKQMPGQLDDIAIDWDAALLEASK